MNIVLTTCPIQELWWFNEVSEGKLSALSIFTFDKRDLIEFPYNFDGIRTFFHLVLLIEQWRTLDDGLEYGAPSESETFL